MQARAALCHEYRYNRPSVLLLTAVYVIFAADFCVMMEIVAVEWDRKRYLDLLLMADEQESMIDRYIARGDMFAAVAGGRVCGVCLVTDEGGGTAEIKNLAVEPAWRGRGVGRMMVDFVRGYCRGRFSRLTVGTGDSPATVPFYERCGFVRSHVVKDFFIDNYDHPIVEAGVVLRDMIYFSMEL